MKVAINNKRTGIPIFKNPIKQKLSNLKSKYLKSNKKLPEVVCVCVCVFVCVFVCVCV